MLQPVSCLRRIVGKGSGLRRGVGDPKREETLGPVNLKTCRLPIYAGNHARQRSCKVPLLLKTVESSPLAPSRDLKSLVRSIFTNHLGIECVVGQHGVHSTLGWVFVYICLRAFGVFRLGDSLAPPHRPARAMPHQRLQFKFCCNLGNFSHVGLVLSLPYLVMSSRLTRRILHRPNWVPTSQSHRPHTIATRKANRFMLSAGIHPSPLSVSKSNPVPF